MKLWNLLGVLVVLAAVRPLRCSHISLIGALQPTKGADSYAGGGDTSTAGATSASATANEATAGAEPATRAATEPAATKAATAAASAGTKKATPVNPGPTAASPWDHAELWAQHGTCEYLYVSGQRQDGPNWMSHRDARKGERAPTFFSRVCALHTRADTPGQKPARLPRFAATSRRRWCRLQPHCTRKQAADWRVAWGRLSGLTRLVG